MSTLQKRAATGPSFLPRWKKIQKKCVRKKLVFIFFLFLLLSMFVRVAAALWLCESETENDRVSPVQSLCEAPLEMDKYLCGERKKKKKKSGIFRSFTSFLALFRSPAAARDYHPQAGWPLCQLPTHVKSHKSTFAFSSIANHHHHL